MKTKPVKVMLVTEHYTQQDLAELSKDELLGMLIDPCLQGIQPVPLMGADKKPSGERMLLFQYREIITE